MKKHILTLSLAVLPTLWLAGCQTAETRQSQTEQAEPAKTVAQLTAEKTLAEAKAGVAKGNEWRDTGKLIKSAASALKAGDFAKAQKLAEEAITQEKLAAIQAKENQNAGNPDYLYQ